MRGFRSRCPSTESSLSFETAFGLTNTHSDFVFAPVAASPRELSRDVPSFLGDELPVTTDSFSRLRSCVYISLRSLFDTCLGKRESLSSLQLARTHGIVPISVLSEFTLVFAFVLYTGHTGANRAVPVVLITTRSDRWSERFGVLLRGRASQTIAASTRCW